MVVPFLVPAPGHVVREDTTSTFVQVESTEEWDDCQSLHGQSQIVAKQGGQAIRLAVESQRHPLDLLVVFEFDTEQSNQLDGDAGRTSNSNDGVLIGLEDLLDVLLGNQVAHGRPPVPSHDHAP